MLNHGAFGELGPVVAMAVLLSSRNPGASLVVLAAFALLAVLASLPSSRLQRDTSRLVSLIRAGAETTGQTTVRLTLLLLVLMETVAVAFDLDVVLGAFAAGFILRRALPEGSRSARGEAGGAGVRAS